MLTETDKVRKKERTIHQHTGADRNIHSSRTHIAMPNNSLRGTMCGQRFQVLGEQRKGNSKYCQCPGVAS